MFTEEQQQKYLEDSEACPHCSGRSLLVGQDAFCGNTVYRNIVCRSCKKEWQEVFTLTAIEENQF